MKHLMILSAILASSGAFAAEKIECTLDGASDGNVVATLVRAAPFQNTVTFDITVADEVNSGFFSTEDRAILLETKANADKLSDWDGNSGVEISFRKGFLAQGVGGESKAFLYTYYRDGETDDVRHVLRCSVVR